MHIYIYIYIYMCLADELYTRKVYNEIHGTNVRELSTFNTLTIYSDKSQPTTKKHFAQEYKFFRANQ